jgi:hypothetical protein
MVRVLVLCAALAGLLGQAVSSHAEPAASYCRGPGLGNTVLPTPGSLVGSVAAAFGVRMPPAEVAAQTVIRCDNGVVLACMTGANLNCGKADVRTTSVGGDAWCREHPNASFIPMFATGHATIFAWRCDGAHAVPERQAQAVDAQGYTVGNWRRLSGP